jgi:hypothetical protein
MRIRGIGRGMIALTISLCAIGVDTGIPDARVSSSGSGATVHVGHVSPFTPATFTDLNTGEEYFVALFATEIEPGVGAVWFALSDAFTSGGGAAGDGVIGVGDATAPVTLSFCSTLGPTAQAGVQNGELFGTQPGGGIKCGEAPRQVVTVTSHAVCEADITVHGSPTSTRRTRPSSGISRSGYVSSSRRQPPGSGSRSSPSPAGSI